MTTLFTRSTDGGRTFSMPIPAPALGPSQTIAGMLPGVAVDPSGNVYVSTLPGYPVIQVSKLTNGGSTLVGTVNATRIVPIPSSLPGASFRDFTIPQIAADAKGVYVVWDDFRTNNANVMITRSTDGGATWSVAARVNDVTTGHHFFPTITSSGSIVSIAWYDSRFNTGVNMTSLDVFYTQSLDGGASFSSSVRVTSVSFNPELVLRTDGPNSNQTFIGDYIGISASPTAIHPIWADNRNACDTVDPKLGCLDQDAFTATITVNNQRPDFTITSSPSSLTLKLETSTTTSIALTSTNGFTGTIILNATITPTGKQGPFLVLGSTSATISAGNPATVLLTVTAKGSTPLGNYVVTLAASSGKLSHTTTIQITVVNEH